MDNIISCKRCLYTNKHPLGLTIDDEGICSGCRIHEEKDYLDWDERLDLLKSIIKPYKSKSRSNYDCIVPVTGGNDSYFIVHVVKNILKLNPLLVTHNKYFNTPLGIRNLSNLRIKFDCDIIIQNVNMNSVKKITKETLRRFGSIYWPCIAGQTVFPVKTAINYKIPLIIWGAHQGLEQVGMYSHLNQVEMSRRYRKDHDLMGFEAEDLVSIENNLTEEDIYKFKYPEDDELNSVGVRGIYLGNFIRWDPKAQHELMIKLYDYETSAFSRSFDTYEHVDCFNYMDIHDQLKLIKNGYSRVTDHATREIRHKRISREQGLYLVRKFQLSKIKYLDLFCEWLGVSKKSMPIIFNYFRNPLFWQEKEPGEFRFNGLSEYIKKELTNIPHSFNFSEDSNFEINSTLIKNLDRKYIIIGKGFP